MKSGGAIQPFTIQRRAVGANDIGIDIHWVGVCHTDIHCVRSEWGEETFPMVPGHEITGFVSVVRMPPTRIALVAAAADAYATAQCNQTTQPIISCASSEQLVSEDAITGRTRRLQVQGW